MNKRLGVTLLELMLVLAILTVFLLVGFRVYRQFSQEAYVAELKGNVDFLFQIMSTYYQANCREGPISPKYMGDRFPWPIYPMPIPTLERWGFLNPNEWRPQNPLLSPTQPYILQFNSVTGTRNITTQLYSIDSRNPRAPSPPMPIIKRNSVVFWKLQVAVRMRDTTNMNAYRGMLGANCVSSLDGDKVTPCDKNPKPGPYLVFERLPSFAVPSNSSLLWPSLQRVQQFNQQYTNDDFYALNKDDPNWNRTSGYENYLCGG